MKPHMYLFKFDINKQQQQQQQKLYSTWPLWVIKVVVFDEQQIYGGEALQ